LAEAEALAVEKEKWEVVRLEMMLAQGLAPSHTQMSVVHRPS
jgi:hypothetical protein